jgi:hypothetical protein
MRLDTIQERLVDKNLQDTIIKYLKIKTEIFIWHRCGPVSNRALSNACLQTQILDMQRHTQDHDIKTKRCLVRY